MAQVGRIRSDDRSYGIDGHCNLPASSYSGSEVPRHLIEFRRAMMYVSARQEEKAIPGLRQTIGLKPDFADAYNHLALALANTGRLTEALGLLDDVIDQFRAALEFRRMRNTRCGPQHQGQVARRRRSNRRSPHHL